MPQPTSAPLSKTRILSACRSEDVRCETNEYRRLIRQCGKRAAQCLFGHIVERGSGVVQNEDLGITHKCAGNGKALALSARKVAAFGGNLHIEPALTLYEVCGLRSLYGCLHLFVVGIFIAPK